MTFEKIKARYDAGRMTIGMLKVYVQKGVLTAAQFEEITGEEYSGGGSGDNEILNILLGEEA